MKRRFPYIAQYDTMDCGPACLCMVSQYYGKPYAISVVKRLCYLSKEGVSLLGISDAAQKIGLETASFRANVQTLRDEMSLPCILHWKRSHFVVLYKIINIHSYTYYYIADPATGKIRLNEKEFCDCWLCGEQQGVVMFLEPTEVFYRQKVVKESDLRKFYIYLKKYVKAFKGNFISLLFALFMGSLFALFLPFLTQVLIDKGIKLKSTNIVFMVVLSQFVIYLGMASLEIIRNWLVLFIGAKINIGIISDYLHKIIRKGMTFFDTKFLNDFYQRIQDHSRIEQFLTSQSLTTFFLLVTLIVYLIVLLKYDTYIFVLYLLLTFLAVLWSTLFMSVRERLDYFRFKYNALTQESINEIVLGIQEIKLNAFEHYKIRQWEIVQNNAFENKQKILKVEQFQMVGFGFINQIKTILISLISASMVIDGTITLGAMISISFIVSQIDAPITQLINFLKSLQDARLSLSRLIEVQDIEDYSCRLVNTKNLSVHEKGIRLQNVSFQYEDPLSKFVVDNVDMFIPQGKITAIVGQSGCGKTTLLKLLLKLYEPTKGQIFINGENLNNIHFENWRERCGAVMQDTYIFSDSIARNIALSDEIINYDKLIRALKLANIYDFVESLPKKADTIIGLKGNGLSNGQRQRLVLARVIYKSSDFVFLDEATSALDSINEKSIYNNIKEMFKGKTVIVIAHRLSTIKNADQIIVMKEGAAIEIGTHDELISQKGDYYQLVLNQIQ